MTNLRDTASEGARPANAPASDTGPRSATPLDKRFGAMIKTRRIELGMNQHDLARKIGVTFQQIQKYERGQNRIAASRLPDIAAALQMRCADFFEDAAADSGATRLPPLPAYGVKIAKILNRLPEPSQRMMYLMVKAAADGQETKHQKDDADPATGMKKAS